MWIKRHSDADLSKQRMRQTISAPEYETRSLHPNIIDFPLSLLHLKTETNVSVKLCDSLLDTMDKIRKFLSN
jgi:hypothetical protein